ncbi:MAG TPA: hypothetical protein VJ777_22450 [Mycobacterium sp.]|nr:hypothetical protein [Mycobacterium sp.]
MINNTELLYALSKCVGDARDRCVGIAYTASVLRHVECRYASIRSPSVQDFGSQALAGNVPGVAATADPASGAAVGHADAATAGACVLTPIIAACFKYVVLL